MTKDIRSRIFSAGALLLTTAALLLGALTSAKEMPQDESKTQPMASQEESVNILLMGADDEAGLCDVIMIANLDMAQGRAAVVQLPRDTYAAYTDGSYKKLNGICNSLGGAKQTAELLEKALGIDIHGYLKIDLDSLGRAVDAVGGVDIDVPRDMYYSDPEQGLYISIKKGLNHLDGNGAKSFVRYRAGYVDGDLGRIDAQKLFMAAFFEKLSQGASVSTVLELCRALSEAETDISIASLAEWGNKALSLRGDSITLLTLPGEQTVATVSGASYYALCKSSCAEAVREYLGGNGEFDPQGIFKNCNYESFINIYEGSSVIRTVTVAELLSQNG